MNDKLIKDEIHPTSNPATLNHRLKCTTKEEESDVLSSDENNRRQNSVAKRLSPCTSYKESSTPFAGVFATSSQERGFERTPATPPECHTDSISLTRNQGKVFRLGELFCGPGGIAWGAMNAHINEAPEYKIVHEWANDYDKDTCNTYIRNICPDRLNSVVCGDIRELDFSKLYQIGDIDALAFGFPCNDFSIVGEQKGFDGKFGPLYSYGVKVLKDKQPQWFLAENVGGLQSANEGRAMQTIFAAMRDAGYRLYPNLYKFKSKHL